MKKNFYITLLLIGLFSFTGCNQTLVEDDGRYMNFSSTIDTKADHTAFSATDELGLYVVERKSTSLSDDQPENMSLALEKNLKCTVKGGQLVIPKSVEYPQNNTDIYSYYPYVNVPASGTSLSLRDIEIKADQSLANDYIVSDFKVASVINHKKPDVSNTDKAIKLIFKHKLCKVLFKIKSTTYNFNELKTLVKGVKVNNVALTGTFDLMTGVITPAYTSVSANTITTNGALSENGSILEGVQAIIMPRQKLDPVPVIVIETSDGRDSFKATLNDTELLEQGNTYTYTIDVNKDSGIITYQTDIQPWNASSSTGNME